MAERPALRGALVPISARPPKRGKLAVNEGLAIVVQTTDPWYKKHRYLRLLPPWSKLRGYLTEIAKRPALEAAAMAFQSVAHGTAGVERWQRRTIIASVLRGKRYPGRITSPRTPGRKLSEAEMSALISRLR